jgi:acyl-coenzyme A thioesterase PaaI-like protein
MNAPPASGLDEDRPSPLEVYRYIGCSATETTTLAAHGHLPWRPDLSIKGQPSMAPLAVFTQIMAGVNVFPITPMVVPTSVVVHLRGEIADHEELEGTSNVVRAGRSSAVTAAIIAAASKPATPIAHAIATWAFPGGPIEPRGPLPPTSVTPFERPYEPTLLEWLAPIEHPDGLAIDDVRPAIAEPVALGGTQSSTLHGGPIQILNEAAARRHAQRTSGTDPIVLLDFASYFLAPARGAPLVARAATIAHFGHDLDVRVELRAADNRLCTFSEARFRVG